VLSVASLLADAIRRIGQNRSISELYEEQEQQPPSPDSLGSTLFEAGTVEPHEPAVVTT
jgi:hypothetical protein